MSYTDIIKNIESLPHVREAVCHQCGSPIRTHVLTICAKCPQCGQQVKLRGYAAIGAEIEDVIDAVLEWMGEGERLVAVMKRHDEIHSQKAQTDG